MKKIIYEPIGFIYSPIRKKYLEGIVDLEGFSHLMLLYHFHLSGEPVLSVKPFLDENFHGLFATRASARPNPIGISIVRLKKIKGSTLHVLDVDIVDRTPLLDIKPYIPQFDIRTDCRIGWLRDNIFKMSTVADDGRFLGAQFDEPMAH
jgi:tRNA-Thr(GGU) m(6)t(6)A37 methyltransferase TsaA